MGHREEKNGRKSVPQFGGWDQNSPDTNYTVVFSQARANRKQNKTDLTEFKRNSLGNEQEFMAAHPHHPHHHHQDDSVTNNLEGMIEPAKSNTIWLKGESRGKEANERRGERAGESSVGGKTTERKKEFEREDAKLHTWKMVGG
ncbi:hypothetical protein D8674_021858 [Pyrus ussuriensis x Pyrus communis]|uniref:RIN4 pathogenic type III effector avirulence factor Avr cleavage site domain-containing protein n=1 Tax=Pyrus ussuriensis x Pyrus communis TaxID=2448454 RepID=A0A5N5GPW0_9ROSA|nr:hypothetical protein D8674_021858 [Pyrus ussuriensis x Pyrus communis]